MIPVKFGKIRYHLDPEMPGIIFDSKKSRISQNEIHSQHRLSSEEFWKILDKLKSRSEESHKTLTYPELEEYIRDNWSHNHLENWVIPTTDIKQWTKGINYGICPNRPLQVFELLTKVYARSNSVKWKSVRVSSPGAKKIDWGPKLKQAVSSPYGSCDQDGFSSIPLLIPVLTSHILKRE